MIAIIAGTGSLPLQAGLNLLQSNKPFFIISLFPQDNFAQLKNVLGNKIEIIAQDFCKLGEILNILKQKKATHILFIGKVDKKNLIKKIKLDWLGLKLLASVACKSDKAIMEKLLEEAKRHNLDVINQKDVLNSLLVEPGVLTGKLTSELKSNIEFGIDAAQKISFCDVGQTVVVKDKMIIAVEAIEGTDLCIKRGIELGKKDVIICKTAHQNHNNKYDLPTLGPDSLKNIKPGEIQAIAWQSSQTFIANKDEFVAKAKELNITLVSL